MKSNQSKWLFWSVLGGAVFIFFVLTVYALIVYSVKDEDGGDFAFSGSKIGVVDIHGPIMEAKSWVEQLKKMGDNPSIKAIILHIDSPGGGVAASQEVYTEVLRIREHKKKIVVASMASVGASGAYYISCACDKIMANPGSITGSIGVIAEYYNYGELLRWAKMQSVVFKSGELKDAPSPVRALTENEKKYMQSIIDDMYNQFTQAVSKGRKMDIASVKLLADGRVYTGLDAKAKKLIDEVGSFQDAVEYTAKLAQLQGEPKLVHTPKERRTLIDLLTGDVSSLFPFPFSQTMPGVQIQFSYIWK
jgi:protease IV